MQELLDNFLSDNASQDLKQAIAEAHHIFDLFELPNYEFGYEELLMSDNTLDTGGTLDLIVRLTTSLQHRSLADHGVRISTDADIDTLTLFLNGLYSIQNFDQPEQLADTLKLSLNNPEKFAEVLALVLNNTVEELLPYIEEVEDGLFRALSSLIKTDIVPEVADAVEIDPRHVMLFNKLYSGLLTNPPEITKKLLQTINPGFSFTTYLDLVYVEVFALDVKKAAAELLAMAVISNDGLVNPRLVLDTNLEKYVPEVITATLISVEFNKILVRLEL